MRKIVRLLLCLGVLLPMSSVAEAQPASIVDQMQPATISSLTWAIGGDSQQQLAQTVTVGLSGTLEGLMLPIACASGRLVIEIGALNGEVPGDVVLARRRFDAAEVPAIGSPFRPVFRLFRLGRGLSSAAGDRFAVVLRNPTGSCGIYQARPETPMGQGRGFMMPVRTRQGGFHSPQIFLHGFDATALEEPPCDYDGSSPACFCPRWPWLRREARCRRRFRPFGCTSCR